MSSSAFMRYSNSQFACANSMKCLSLSTRFLGRRGLVKQVALGRASVYACVGPCHSPVVLLHRNSQRGRRCVVHAVPPLAIAPARWIDRDAGRRADDKYNLGAAPVAFAAFPSTGGPCHPDGLCSSGIPFSTRRTIVLSCHYTNEQESRCSSSPRLGPGPRATLAAVQLFAPLATAEIQSRPAGQK